MSPDWSAKAVTIPYADLNDPQSLNLYSYVRNRPTVLKDLDGHKDCPDGASNCKITTQTNTSVGLSSPFPGANVIVTVTQSTTTSYTDANGNTVEHVVTKETQATYSSEKGKEGQFLGAATKTSSLDIVNGKLDNYNGPGNWEKSNVTASQFLKMMGPKAAMQMIKLTTPDIYSGAAKSAAQHPAETIERGAAGALMALCFVGEPCGAIEAGLSVVVGAAALGGSLSGDKK